MDATTMLTPQPNLPGQTRLPQGSHLQVTLGSSIALQEAEQFILSHKDQEMTSSEKKPHFFV